MELKTDIFRIDNVDVSGIRTNALDETERVAYAFSMNQKESLQLRLLTEEMFGLIQSIAPRFTSKFWLEGCERNIELHLVAYAELDEAKKEQVVSVSSSGQNEADKGIMSKLVKVCDKYLYFLPETSSFLWMNPGYMDMGNGSSGLTGSEYSQVWSLKKYSESIEANKSSQEEEWDELEKSIISKLADDVIVGVKDGKVEIVISKTF